jgi:hypothetical protein
MADRPDRHQPLAMKRRPKSYPLPRMPWKNARKLITGGIMRDWNSVTGRSWLGPFDPAWD